MHKFFITLTLIFSLVLSSGSAVQAGQSCEEGTACVDIIGSITPATAPVDDMVCVWFTQRVAGVVKIVLYAKPPVGDSHVGSGVLFEKARWHPTRSRYCFGKWRLEGAVWMLVCTDKGPKGEHATRGIPSLTKLRDTGSIDVCSLGQGC